MINFIDNFWPYMIDLVELMLFMLFVRMNLRIQADMRHRTEKIAAYMSAYYVICCVLRYEKVPEGILVVLTLVLGIGYVGIFFQGSLYRRIFWAVSYTALCRLSEWMTYSIPKSIYKSHAMELFLKGELLKPFITLYLAMLTIFVLMSRNLVSRDFSLREKLEYIGLSFAGLAIGHYILRLTLESLEKFSDPVFSARLSRVNLFLVMLFLALLIYTDQISRSREQNRRLLEKQKIHELERIQFENLKETTKRLRELKHDMQIHLDTMNLMMKEGKWEELDRYMTGYAKSLTVQSGLFSTGNIVIDSVLSGKIRHAQQLCIPVRYSVIMPQQFPIEPVELASLLGNLWNNAIEASVRLLESDTGYQPDIYFYIRPYRDMVLIHLENTYDGVLVKGYEREYMSRKKNKEHGIGIHRIEAIVKKANGVISISDEAPVFSVHIMIPEREDAYENRDS